MSNNNNALPIECTLCTLLRILWKLCVKVFRLISFCFSLIHFIFFLPVERHCPFLRSALRRAVRSAHVWRWSAALLPQFAVNKQQQTLQRLLTRYKTLLLQKGRGSSLTVAPEVRGHSPRCCCCCCCSLGFSWAHPPGWMRRSSRCSCFGFSPSCWMGAGSGECECDVRAAAGFCSRGWRMFPVQAH